MKMRHISAGGPDKRSKKSLEQKNKEGRCYYQLLDKINVLAKKVGKVPTQREFIEEFGEGYLGSIRGTFGSWNAAVTVAGLEPRVARGRSIKYDRERVGEMLKEFYKIEGRPPRLSDLGRGYMPSAKVLRRLFNGSIIEARRFAGMSAFDYIHENGAVEAAL